MPDSIVQVTSGAGPKLHTWQSTIGANNVEDEFVLMGMYPYATYEVHGAGISIATANDHVLCLNSAASIKLRVVRIRVEQQANATAAASAQFRVLRTTTSAPTGGTAVTANPFDTADAASSAAGRTLPTAKGTEAAELLATVLLMRQAILATSAQMDDAWEWTALNLQKAIVVPAGTTSGLVIKSLSAIAGATVNVSMEFVETAF